MLGVERKLVIFRSQQLRLRKKMSDGRAAVAHFVTGNLCICNVLIYKILQIA